MLSHHERRHLPYTQQQLFDLVADVDRYAEFLPWMAASRIRRREGNTVWVEMEIGRASLRRRFGSKGVLEPPHRIAIEGEDPLFERFSQVWTFEPAQDGGTHVEVRVDIAFRSRFLGGLMEQFMNEVATDLVAAFKHRARQIYGPDGRKAAAAGRPAAPASHSRDSS